MSIIELPYKFAARTYQSEVFRKIFIEKYLHIFWLVHRRAGKTKTAINMLTARGMQRVGLHLYMFPQTNQAKRVIWRGIDGQGMRFLDHIPAELIAKRNNIDMSVELINGSILQLGGSNNFDAWMGTNPVSIIYDEFPLHNPLAREYLNPILLENGGVEILLGTPRGKNHAWQVYQYAINDPSFWVNILTVDQTSKEDGSRIITEEMIEAERRRGVQEEIIRQEYYCDFNVGILGAYFTKEMDKMDLDGRILDFDIKKSSPVYTSWDLGVSDPTCITFFQRNGDFVDIIYYLEKTDEGPQYFKKQLDELSQRFGITYKYHWAPHDIMKREWGSSARSSLALARDAGIHFLRVPDVGIDNGIQAVRALLPTVRIHKSNCRQLVDALREYRREYDDENRVFKSKPFHNWASHPADSVRYMSVAWWENFSRPEMNEVRTYKSGFGV